MGFFGQKMLTFVFFLCTHYFLITKSGHSALRRGQAWHEVQEEVKDHQGRPLARQGRLAVHRGLRNCAGVAEKSAGKLRPGDRGQNGKGHSSTSGRPTSVCRWQCNNLFTRLVK